MDLSRERERLANDDKEPGGSRVDLALARLLQNRTARVDGALRGVQDDAGRQDRRNGGNGPRHDKDDSSDCFV